MAEKFMEKERKALEKFLRPGDAGHRRANGPRPFSKQLPVRRLCERRAAPGGRRPSGYHRVEQELPANTAHCFPSGKSYLNPSNTYRRTTG